VKDGAVRARILAAAKTEFSRRGLKGASVRAIAGRARVTAAMINYYFRGKQALYDAVVSEAMERLYARLGGALTAKPRAPATAMADAYFDFLVAERELQVILLREMLDKGEGAGRFARRHMPILGAMIGAGVKHKDREPLLHTAVSLFGAVAGYFIYEPILKELLDGPPLSARNLAARRRHVLELAARLEPAGFRLG
jgi:AcrR family transcriptional regulator